MRATCPVPLPDMSFIQVLNNIARTKKEICHAANLWRERKWRKGEKRNWKISQSKTCRVKVCGSQKLRRREYKVINTTL